MTVLAPHKTMDVDGLPPKTTQQLIDEDLAVLDQESYQLEMKKVVLRRRRNAAAPINILLDECLLDIFLRVLEDERAEVVEQMHEWYPDKEFHRLQQYPLKLLSVCARWKDLAYSSPQLWSYSQLAIGSNGEPLYASNEGFLEHRQRAKSLPVSLDLRIEHFPRERGVSAFTSGKPPREVAGRDILLSTIQQSRRLTVHFADEKPEWEPIPMPRSALFDQLSTRMPYLEDLCLSDPDGVAYTHASFILPYDVNNLRRLQLRNITLKGVSAVHLATLASLKLFRCSIERAEEEVLPEEARRRLQRSVLVPGTGHNEFKDTILIRDLQCATELEHLSLQKTFTIILQHESLPIVTLQRLKHLEIIQEECKYPIDTVPLEQYAHTIDNLLRHIRMPALHTLLLSFGTLPCTETFGIFATYDLPLRSLRLQDVAFESEDLLKLLTVLTELVHLSFSSATVTETLLEGTLAHPTLSATRCPSLIQLSICGTWSSAEQIPDYQRYTVKALVALVSSRKKSPHTCPISTLKVSERCLVIREEARNALEDCVENLNLCGHEEGEADTRFERVLEGDWVTYKYS